CSILLSLLVILWRPPISTLFPYTTLFRSNSFHPKEFHSTKHKFRSIPNFFTPQTCEFAPIHNFPSTSKKFRSTNCKIHSIPNFFAPHTRVFAPFSVFSLHAHEISLDNKLFRSIQT